MAEDFGAEPKTMDVPVIQATYSLATGTQDGLSFSTYFAQDDEPAKINGVLDKLSKAARRQKARNELPSLYRTLENLERQHERAMDDFQRIDAQHDASNAGKRTPGPMAPKMRHERANAELAMQRWKEEIGKAREAIDEHEKILKGL